MAACVAEHGEDAFRTLFRYYRRRQPAQDLSHVVHFSGGTGDDKGSQAFWLRQCLKTYPQKPNVCNLDMHMSLADTDDIWGKSANILRNPSGGKKEPKTLLEKLRWVTLGYHYNWTTKTYSPDHYTPFPADLRSLSGLIAAAVGFPGFHAEAGILNYYRSDSSLGIHVDDGDVMVMSGQSRLLYHAVPRILQDHPPAGLGTALSTGQASPQGSAWDGVSEEDWAVCSRYIQSARVNMTVRQVLGPGQSFPEVRPREGLQGGRARGVKNGD
ncbi:hypothetical protein CRUP_018156 [Coryphaenoides rupestris]|nr:hypothetical protein CRUP_018156 [Coryphaenoides rupestris]